MIELEINENPNCEPLGQVIFKEIDTVSLRKVSKILVWRRGEDVLCDVVGVDSKEGWIPAQCQKIEDSGEGVAYLIFGGDWGIRLKPTNVGEESSWSLEKSGQWGETHKIYGKESDIVFQD